MIVPTLLIAAAGAGAASNSDATALTCNLALTDGSQFQLDGHFDADGLHSNLSRLIKVEGVLAPMAPEYIIVIDGSEKHSWWKTSGHLGVVASLTKYGLGPAALTVEKRTFVGRHWGKSLIGVGLCDVRSGQAGRKAS